MERRDNCQLFFPTFCRYCCYCYHFSDYYYYCYLCMQLLITIELVLRSILRGALPEESSELFICALRRSKLSCPIEKFNEKTNSTLVLSVLLVLLHRLQKGANFKEKNKKKNSQENNWLSFICLVYLIHLAPLESAAAAAGRISLNTTQSECKCGTRGRERERI